MARLFFLIVAFAVLFAQAQETAPTFRDSVTYVHLDAAAIQGKRVVPGLQAKDFVVFDENLPQTIAAFGQESVPLDLILLLDVSGSMRTSITELAAIGKLALQKLQPVDRVAVIAFSLDSKVEQDLTSDKGAVSAAIQRAAEGGEIGLGTRINAAVLDSAKYFLKSPRDEAPQMVGRRRAILIVTDNQPIGNHVPNEDVIRALFDSDAVLYGLVVIHSKHRHSPDPAEILYPEPNPENVFPLSEATGGEADSASNPREKLAEMLAHIRSRYSMTYHAPEAPPGKLRYLRVELSASARSKFPDAVVRVRKGYYAHP